MVLSFNFLQLKLNSRQQSFIVCLSDDLFRRKEKRVEEKIGMGANNQPHIDLTVCGCFQK